MVSHWSNAVIPVAMLIFGTVAGLFLTGEGDSVQAVIATADSYEALLWGSLVSIAAAVAMTLGKKLLAVGEMLEGMMEGMHTMFDGLLILVMAWALSAITVELGTADYLMSVFGDIL